MSIAEWIASVWSGSSAYIPGNDELIKEIVKVAIVGAVGAVVVWLRKTIRLPGTLPIKIRGASENPVQLKKDGVWSLGLSLCQDPTRNRENSAQWRGKIKWKLEKAVTSGMKQYEGETATENVVG